LEDDVVFINQKFIRRLCIIVLMQIISQPVRAEVVVVTGAQRPSVVLSQNQVSDLFLGKVASFPDGKSASPIDQLESSPLRDEFYGRVTNKTSAQAKSNRAKLYFTGRGAPPREGAGNEEVKKLLNLTPGGIGYIERSSLDSSVKVIQIVQPQVKGGDVKGGNFGE
jgi:ABC-type phosphate transport system substrate-binding protein